MKRRVAEHSIKRKGSTPESALLIINSQRSTPLACWFQRLNGWKQPPSAIIDKHHFRLRVFIKQRQTNNALPQPRSTISPSRFSGRCCIRSARQYPARCGRRHSHGCGYPVSTFQFPANGLRRIGQRRPLKVQLIKRAFFHASVVVVGRALFRTVPAWKCGCHGLWHRNNTCIRRDHFAQRTQLLFQHASVFGTLISTTPGCCG